MGKEDNNIRCLESQQKFGDPGESGPAKIKLFCQGS